MGKKNEIQEVPFETLPADPLAVVTHSPWHVIPREDWERDERGVVAVLCPQCEKRFALDNYSIVFDGVLVHTFDAAAKDTIPETATLKHECGFDQLSALGGFEGI